MKSNTSYIKKIFYLMLIFLSANSDYSCAQVLLKKQVTLMGSVFEITIVDQDTLHAQNNIDLVIAEVTRIENLISEWRPETQISEVNRYAGIKPVKVDREVFDLTKRAIDYSNLSNGAFDISIVGLDNIWKFDGSMTEVPSADAIRKSVENVGYQYIVLDSLNCSIYLTRPGMKIGFGSIGKGYAADRGRALMQAKAVEAGIVNASGDLSTWGHQLDNKPWLIGIKNPFKSYKTIKILRMNESAVATSGSYEKYAEIDNQRYTHIINPKTGYPSTGLTSVTIYGPSTEFANALSTSIMVLGQKEGIKLAKKYPTYQYLLITDTGKIFKSR
ncbi:FAD:protein FMN transferase [Sphingobacterium sp. SRCM116780]|uniref:FAD:protein FMN transferase n=1 Tax=Sphingobacterium sp. SRCM116780 TaxID=2907623 RepID=UPI001F3020AD|nr:FAD:protein FMN transferase [Sphingobacterium sp. SRCM116780]UIR56609.1 FAD:protein FMN transferase [Sphingobacterium sp. SRCM116780]